MVFKDKNLEEKISADGYVVVPFLSREEVNNLSSFFNELGKRFTTGLHVTMFVKDAEYRKKADNAIKSAFRKSCEKYFSGYRMLYANFMVKEPGQESEFPIHQDWTYVDEVKHKSIAIWVPLIDVDERNGALQVMEKSHDLIRTPRGPGLKSPYENLYPVIKEKYLTTVPLQAGEAVMWDHGLVHCSPPNLSGQTRLAATVIMVPENAEVYHYLRKAEDPLEKIHQFLVDTEFYMNYNIDEKPADVKNLGFIHVEIPSITEQQLAAYCRKSFNGKTEKDAYKTRSKEVADYYDNWNEKYKEVYGDVIQAFRPDKEDALLNHTIEKADLKNGQLILDAGCGNCGPAIHFAKNLDVKIEALTVSAAQKSESEKRINEKNLSPKITVRQGDYHELETLYPPNHFDRILFLESLGHAGNPEQVIHSAYQTLKPGCSIYIKDFYFKTPEDPALHERIMNVVKNINLLYTYNCLSLEETISSLRKSGFEIDFIQRFTGFENTSVRAEFESRFGIDIYGGEHEFYFSEWLEIRCLKPLPQ